MTSIIQNPDVMKIAESLQSDSFSPTIRNVSNRSEPSSAREMEREIAREYRAELRQLREEVEQHRITILQNENILRRNEEKNEAALRRIEEKLNQFFEENRDTLHGAKTIVNAGITFRYIIIATITLTAVIGGISTTIEVLRKWLHLP